LLEGGTRGGDALAINPSISAYDRAGRV
jgi:hypothetical protein